MSSSILIFSFLFFRIQKLNEMKPPAKQALGTFSNKTFNRDTQKMGMRPVLRIRNMLSISALGHRNSPSPNLGEGGRVFIFAVPIIDFAGKKRQINQLFSGNPFYHLAMESLESIKCYHNQINSQLFDYSIDILKPEQIQDLFNKIQDIFNCIAFLRINDLSGDCFNSIDSQYEVLNDEMKSLLKSRIDISDSIAEGQDLFDAGRYDRAIQMFEELAKNCTENTPLQETLIYEELCRIYLTMQNISKGKIYLKKQEESLDKLSSHPGRRLRQAQFYSNQIQLHHAENWKRQKNNPYTSWFSENPKDMEKLELIINTWKALFNPPSDDREKNELGLAYSESGIRYSIEHKYKDAIDEYQTALDLLTDLRRVMETRINLGDLYQHLENGHRQAIHQYTEAKKLSLQLKVPHATGVCLMNEAFCHYQILLADRGKADFHLIPQLGEIEKKYREAITIFSDIEFRLDNIEYQVKNFNVHDISYICLENFLWQENKKEAALEIAQTRRARALNTYINKKAHPSLFSQPTSLTYTDIQHLAKQLDTTFIVYSLADFQHKRRDPCVRFWTISEGDISSDEFACSQENFLKSISDFSENMRNLTLSLRDKLKESLKNAVGDECTVDQLLDDPQIINPFPRNGSIHALQADLAAWQQVHSKIVEQLESWCNLLIPEKFRNPQTPNEITTLTIVAEGQLSTIPFASLRYRYGDQTRYLIEDHPISIAPSIETLQILNTSPQEPIRKACLTICPALNLEQPLEEIKSVLYFEAKESKKLRKEKATSKAFFEAIEQDSFRYIHFAGHGTDTKQSSSDSIFKGAFQLAPDGEGNATYIHGDEIAKMNIPSQLAFISACLTGKGMIHQEGNVGLTWAFLAAGTKSVITCDWPLYDNQLTVKMIAGFYNSLAQGNRKSKALQQAMLIGIRSSRDRPDKWGLFSLSGLDQQIEAKPMHNLGDIENVSEEEMEAAFEALEYE